MVITKLRSIAQVIASVGAGAACHSTPAAPPAPDAAAVSDAAADAPAAVDAASPNTDASAATAVPEGGASAGPAWQHCLRRNTASDSLCGAPHGHFYAWDPQACSGGQFNIAEILQHCEANGPHRGMNIRNWCCP